MTQQPPSAEALELVSRLRKPRLTNAGPASYWHELNLLDAGKAIDALIAWRVSAETVRWENRDRQRLEQISTLQETVQSFQSARDERPVIRPADPDVLRASLNAGAVERDLVASTGEQPAERPAPETVHLTLREQGIMKRALLRSTRPAPEASFAADLAAAQEPLGAEFEKVLHDNLDQLYVRSEPATAVVDYTERARELLKHFSHDYDMEWGIKKVAAALSAVASEREAETASMRSLLDTVYECERRLIAERDAARAKLVRLQEPDVREAVIHALMTTGGWVSSFAGKLPLVSAALADAAIAKITEMLK